MKYTNKPTKLFALLLLLSLTACQSNSQDNKKTSTKPAGDLQTQTSVLKADLYKDKLDELLTPDMAASAAGKEVSQAEKSVNSIGVKYEFGKSGRKKKQLNIEYETTNMVELKFVQDFTLENFKQMYHTPTAEELKRANEAMNAKLAELEKEGKANSQQAGMAGDMANSMGKNLTFDEVPAVGDYAVWNNKDKQLHVFYKGIGFQLLVDAYADEATNKARAIEAANAIINEKLK